MTQRIRSLDGLRGVAVLAVIATHVLPTRGGGGLWIGVDLFFVLSGYLITSILLSEWDELGRVSLRHFYIRRALRLYPPLITLVIAGAFFATAISGSMRTYLRDAVLSVTYLTDIAEFGWGNLGTGMGHTWSLSVEEHFYLVWPPLLLLTLRRGRDPRWTAAAGITLSLFFLWIYRASAGGEIPPGYFAPHARALEPLLGGFLAITLQRHNGELPSRPRGGALAWVGLIGVTAVAVLANSYSRNGYLFPEVVAVGLSATCLVAGIVTSQMSLISRVFAIRPLCEIGRVSYGWYLYHFPVFTVLDHYIADGAVRFALAIPGSLLLAVLSYRFVERPFLRRKHRYQPESGHAVDRQIVDVRYPTTEAGVSVHIALDDVHEDVGDLERGRHG